MGKIVVIGSSNTDMVVTAPKIPVPGETILGNEFNIIAGGKGANQAVAAARAGGIVTFIAKVGDDDFGENAVAGYKADNINTDYIFIDPDRPSGIAIIIVEEGSGQNSIVVAGGANKSLSIDDIKSAEKLISESDVVLIQLEIPLEVVEFSLKLAKKYGVKTILNPAPAQPLSEEILSLVDIITPNESEMQILTGLNPENDGDVEKAAAKLLEKVNETVLVTLGSKGVYFISKSGENGFVPTIKVEAVDTTAAGDVFNGYLAAAIADGESYLEAISISNKAATISVTRKGAQPSIPKINELIKKR
ncbi:MAG: ribokinase [Bacteroidia bacterium]|nr:ribokinase [Bacteroidia bacterium]